ncbi:MAG: DUF3325 family protein [Bacteroidota bacterium]
MGIVLIFLGCFLLYAKSKHFPKRLQHLGNRLRKNTVQTRLVGYLLFVGAYLLLGSQLGWATGFVVFLITLILGLVLNIILLPLHQKYAYILAGLSLLVIIIDNIL